MLRKKFAAEEAQWQLVEKKALTWLKKESKKAGVGDDVDWASVASHLVDIVGV